MVPQPTTSAFALLGRLYWMMLGPLALVVLTLTIVNVGNGWFTLADWTFLAVLGSLVLARWVEFRSGEAQTATGAPATPADLRRYGLVTLPLGLSVWVVANLVGNNWPPH